MKKFITILLIFCTVISTITSAAYADYNENSTNGNKPKIGEEKK